MNWKLHLVFALLRVNIQYKCIHLYRYQGCYLRKILITQLTPSPCVGNPRSPVRIGTSDPLFPIVDAERLRPDRLEERSFDLQKGHDTNPIATQGRGWGGPFDPTFTEFDHYQRTQNNHARGDDFSETQSHRHFSPNNPGFNSFALVFTYRE